jgi:RNA polymerase sigma-70 factor, ECF subfamily
MTYAVWRAKPYTIMTSSPFPTLTPTEFEELIQEIRPELHRYVAHMIGSALDAEDVVQETLIKAHDSLALLNAKSNVRGWLFRVAHNKAMDQLRRYSNQPLELLEEYPITAELDQPLEEKELTTLALSAFLQLAPRQRSCVILKDVLDYSLAEISEMLDATVPEIKAALHRGRTRLRELSTSLEVSAPPLDEHERELLARYVDRFNARDFEALRTMLTDEVQLDLVGRVKKVGAAELSNQYFYNYNQVQDWHMAVGRIEGRLAVLVYDTAEPSSQPAYFILLTWKNSQVAFIRDYYFARHVMRDVRVGS